MQQSPTLSKTNGDVATEEKMVFGRNTIPRQYRELVHEKFAHQKQKVKETVAKLRTHIRNTSIDTEEGQLEVFQANKAMKAELEYYQTLNKRQDSSMNLTREYRAADSLIEKEIFEDAMRLEIEAMTMMKQQQKYDQQSSDTTNTKSTTTTTPTPTPTTTTTMKKKKNKQSMFRKARSQLTLTHLQRSHLTLKKEQQQQLKEQQEQDSDTTDSTHSNTSSFSKPEDDGAPSPSPSPPTPGGMKRSVSMSPGMMQRSVSFSNYTNVKRVPSVLVLLGGKCESSNAAAKDNIWYDRTDFCGFAQKEMSRRSNLGITSTSALHSNVGHSDNDDGYDDDDHHSNDSDGSYDNNECEYLRNRTNPNRMMNRTNNPHRVQ